MENNVKQLEELIKLKDDFLLLCGHDYKAPIDAISELTKNLISKPELLPIEKNENLTKILDSTRQLNSLINEIMDLSNIQIKEDLKRKKAA